MAFRFTFLGLTFVLLSGFLGWQFLVEQNAPFDILASLEGAPVVTLTEDAIPGMPTRRDCDYYSCFDIYRCRLHTKKMLVHIPEPRRYIDQDGHDVAPFSKEFVEILETVANSEYFTEDAESACIIVPAVDLLNEHQVKIHGSGQALQAGSRWNNDGLNHLLFTMLPGSHPDYAPELGVPHGKAMVAAAGLSQHNYRRGFDVSLPVYSPYIQDIEYEAQTDKRWRLTSTQMNMNPKHQQLLHKLSSSHSERLLVTGRCQDESKNSSFRCDTVGDHYLYSDLLRQSTFCLIVRGVRLAQPSLLEAMHLGCIPVIAIDGLVLPFSEVLDWKRFSIRLFEYDLPDLMNIVNGVSDKRIGELQTQLDFVYSLYFSSISRITLTTLDILNDRIFTHLTRTYRDWNVRPEEPLAPGSNPLFLPAISPATDGFTAVILTYDRIESLFTVINRVAETPSLTQIVVVWNNQEKSPPPADTWPKISKPVKIVRTHANVLSNRFFPYDEIETECILSIDDDIVMLTADELEFGYQVWREFPDRIVGFPSRTHVRGEDGRWKYESEWTSDISMVLTGAAFYHKYWNYLFTAAPTKEAKEIKEWVDVHMNCEDIAMNFLVANVTGKAPIKVTPRKKFKCSTPQCINTDMLSGVQAHMVERSDCINMLADKYGYMPLKSVEFRADPVLYKDNFPEKLKKFGNVGSL